MQYSINFERHYKNGKTNILFIHDENIFQTYQEALIHALDMIEMWRKEENELFTFQIISH